MPKKLILAVSQSRTLATLSETLEALAATTRRAARQRADLILFPEAYLGGYPRTCGFGASVGARTASGREQYLRYFQGAVDLGDTPGEGAGEAWVRRTLPTRDPAEAEDGGDAAGTRGDGTREHLERVARETGVFVVTGLVERSGGTLYCAAVYVCPRRGVVGKRRKLMPTGAERLVWGQGAAATLRAVTATIRGVRVTMAAAICWENMMPLLRYALYSQNVNLWLAPTADARDTWLPLMRTVGNEGRCFVLSAISCVRRKNLPPWITDGAAAAGASAVLPSPSLASLPPINGAVSSSPSSPPPASGNTGRRHSTISIEDRHELVLPMVEEHASLRTSSGTHAEPVTSSKAIAPASTTGRGLDASGEEFVCRGGSCITGPMGNVIAEPLWEVEDDGLIIREVDFEDCERGRLDLDVAGSYSRSDAFKLTVQGLDITPPP